MSHLATALLHFQADPPPVHLDARNPHFGSKFASLAGVVAAVRPALNKHGLVFTQLPALTPDGGPAVETRIIHAESGEELSSVMPLMPATNDPQAQGSALTYARRYALLSVLGLVGDEDDDANSAQPKAVDPLGFNESRADAVLPDQLLFTFGKHKGQQIADIPRPYLEWWLTSDSAKSDRNQELRAAVELHLGLAPVAASDMDDIPF